MRLTLPSLARLPFPTTSLLLSLLLSPCPFVNASPSLHPIASQHSGLTLPIRSHPRPRSAHDLTRRAAVNSGHNGSTLVTNSYDTVYMCNITLNGAEFEVLIDTGSSDLWVSGNVPNARNLSIAAKVTYAKGAARGFINTADMVFDDFTVPDQAYISVLPSPENPVEQGVLGLGPSSSSNVRSAVKSSAGNTPLDRIFLQNTTTPNYLTVLLSRLADDPAGPDALAQEGVLTIGRVADVPGLDAILNQPKIPALKDKFGIQHWQAAMDVNGVIGPDGQPIKVNTTIPGQKGTDKSRLHAIFDTGFTFPQVPREVADAIYGRVPGAEFVVGEDRAKGGSPGYWRVPCEYELSIGFMFGGVEVRIAPLDMTMVEKRDRTGRAVSCMATFREIAPDVADHTKFGAFDMILGMAFLRNAYLLIDFGDFVDGRSSSVADPYIQLLPITNTTDAHLDFVTVRLAGADTSSAQEDLLPPGMGKSSPEPDPNSPWHRDNRLGADGEQDAKPWYRQTWFYIAVGVGGVLVLGAVGAVVAGCCCGRRRRSAVRHEGAFVPEMRGAGAYRPLGVGAAGAAAAAGAVGAGRSSSKRPDSPVWEPEYAPYAPYPAPAPAREPDAASFVSTTPTAYSGVSASPSEHARYSGLGPDAYGYAYGGQSRRNTHAREGSDVPVPTAATTAAAAPGHHGTETPNPYDYAYEEPMFQYGRT